MLSPRNLGRGSIGFAVPANTLANLLPRLKEKQVIRPVWLGISVATLDQLLVETLELPEKRGVYVTQVMGGSPADKAELVPSGTDQRGRPTKGGDIIVAVNGTQVDAVSDLITELNRFFPGDEITLTVNRDGERIQVATTLSEWPADRDLRTRSRIFPQPRPDEYTVPKEPLIPNIPGFPFPDLSPEKPGR